MDYEVEKAKELAEKGELYQAKIMLSKFLYRNRNHTEAQLLYNEIEARLANGEPIAVYSPKSQIKTLLIGAIVGAVVGGIIMGVAFEGEGGAIFGGIWLGSGLGCILDSWNRHENFHKKHENLGCFLVAVLAFIGPIGVLIQYLRKRRKLK